MCSSPQVHFPEVQSEESIDIFDRNRHVPAISPEGPISLLLDLDQHYNCSLEHIGLFKAC